MTSRSRSARTWSTALTRTSPPRARRRSSSPTWAEPTSLVLASRSPQRRAILQQLGVSFTVVVADVEELMGGADPVSVAVENARMKAEAVASSGSAVLRAGPVAGIVSPSQAQGENDPRATRPIGVPAAAAPPQPLTPPSMPVVGVDTIVVLDGAVYGKPPDAAGARAMLGRLSGRVHEVVSGVCVVEGEDVRVASATTRVSFRELGPELLDWYVGTGEWEERAGGYAIQGRGAALVTEIEGDYLNVVGLPVATLLELLPGILQAGS